MNQQLTLVDPALTGPGKGIERDRWDRPLIIPPKGGKPKAYTRCTTYVKALDDKEGLLAWKSRMTGIGLSQRPDLLLSLQNTAETDKKALDRICEEAANHAGAKSRATIGTSLHGFTERIDRGETIPDLGQFQPDIEAYKNAITAHGLTPVEMETFVVNDELQVGGTFDRIYSYQGVNYIGDIKTGSTLDYSAGTFAAQLAIYAHSQRYNPQTGERSPLEVDQNKGIVIHLPAGEGKAQVYFIDLALGWASVGLAGEVRRWRAMRPATFLQELQPAAPAAVPLVELVKTAPTPEALMQLWQANINAWTDELNRLAAARAQELATTVAAK